MKKGTKLSTTFDEFTVVEKIGQGGAGMVYKAIASDGTNYAVKVLGKNLSTDKKKRFKNEINFCLKDNHEGIIKIIDHGIYSDGASKLPFYVMPLFDGTFREFIKFENDPQKILRAFNEILDAVEAAHLKSCFHRDLKPENILFSKQQNRMIVSDFGVAHFEEDDLLTAVETKQIDKLANFQYAAPEQKQRGMAVNHLCDVYALGLILNEAFTKLVPHGVGFTKIVAVNKTCEYLDEVIDKMIQQSPENRYQSIEEVKEDIYKKGKIAISLQKLNIIEDTVVAQDDPNADPLIAIPMKFIDTDHDGIRTMTCKLNHRVTSKWVEIFKNRGANSFTSMFSQQNVSFFQDTLTATVPDIQAVSAKRMLDEWLANTNEIYKNQIRDELIFAQTKRREDIQRQAEIEKKRQNLLKQLKN